MTMRDNERIVFSVNGEQVDITRFVTEIVVTHDHEPLVDNSGDIRWRQGDSVIGIFLNPATLESFIEVLTPLLAGRVVNNFHFMPIMGDTHRNHVWTGEFTGTYHWAEPGPAGESADLAYPNPGALPGRVGNERVEPEPPGPEKPKQKRAGMIELD